MAFNKQARRLRIKKGIKNKVSGIPVLDNEKNLVGVIDKSDIVKAFNNVKTDKELSEKYGYLH